MTPWKWWYVAEIDANDNDGWWGEHDSRGEAVEAAQRTFAPGTRFYVIEARSSEAVKHEGSECVPFLRTRNKELVEPNSSTGAGECF